MESSVDKSLGEVTVPCVFTFVPVVQKLPVFLPAKSSLEKTSGAPGENQNENIAASHKETTREAMSEEPLFRAVCIKNYEGEERDTIQPDRNRNTACVPPLDCVSLSEVLPSLGCQFENTPHLGAATMETAVNKHRDISQQWYQSVPGRAEVSSGCFFKTASQDRSSPTNSAELFPTPASSRESIPSACSDKDTSPVSFSRTISTCSSVYSGFFTPSVVQVKKHFLAPGSSLISLPQSCRSSCESLSCPLSSPPRHRPPLTRLSLLTAILRKGRLPILSSSVERPYTPCWPVNNVTLSSCNACSAASSVASIPLELSSRFSSTASIDSQSQVHRDPSRCATAPPHLQPSKTSPQNQTKTSKTNSVPRWQQVISPPPQSSLKAQKNNLLQQIPLPVFSSIVKSVSPISQHEMYVSNSKPKSPKPSVCLSVDNRPNKFTCLCPEPVVELDTGVPQKGSRLPNSSFSKLQSLSQNLKSSSCSSHSQHSQPIIISKRSHPAYSPVTAGGREPDKSSADSKKSHGADLSHYLSPSCYTPMTFPGWPSPSPSPTPTPSPAPPVRELTPSPSLTLRSTPSPRPGSGISDCSDREGKKRKPHKIKSSYKSLAAIPTNTLLLDQQVIDEQVERGECPGDTGAGCVPLGRAVIDTHKAMCSPAQLRRESEELYAVIDEILGSTIPPTSKTPVNSGVQKNSSTSPRTYGRETKYASLGSLYSSGNGERQLDPNKSKPRVIRPMTAIPRLTVPDKDKKSDANPLRQFVVKQTLCDNTKDGYISGEEILRDTSTHSKGQTQREDGKPNALAACDLYITELEEQISCLEKHGSRLSTPIYFGPAERKLQAFQTHI